MMQSPQQRALMEAKLREGIQALNENRPEDCRAALKVAIEAGADNASTWLGMAMACQAAGDIDAAMQAADKSIAHESRNARAVLIKADLFYKKGDKRSAAAFYRDALRVAPPPAQQTPDLQRDLVRADKLVTSLREEFETFLTKELTSMPQADAASSKRFRKAVDVMLGKKQVYYPEPQNFLFPELPVMEFYDPGDFDWVADLEAETDAIRDELNALLSDQRDFQAYVTGEADRPNHDTHGMRGNRDWGAFYLWKDGELVAENAAQCPRTVAAMERVPLLKSANTPNVLFSKLEPKSGIPPHTGMVNTRLICHLPLIIPPGCWFRVGSDKREWQEGKVWLFDDTIQHEAWNDSDQQRVILLFEVWKPELTEDERRLITGLFKSIDRYDS